MALRLLERSTPIRPRSLWAEFRQREPRLALFGTILLALLVPAAIAWSLDGRLFEGVSVWAKPMKFLAAVGLYALTVAWFFGYLPEARRRSPIGRVIVWTILVTGTFEIAYITLQGARAEASHFNTSSPLYIVLYALMGLGALLLTATSLPLAREIARHADPALPSAFRLSLVLGLLLTGVLGIASGLTMSNIAESHAVGGPHGTPGLPLTGWSLSIGDLRVAHFFGVHAMQLLPLAGALLAAILPRFARQAVWIAAGAYVALTVAVFLQAVIGEPLLAL